MVDLPGAFLCADKEDDVVMFMKERLTELIALVAPHAYQKFITTEKGQKVLFVNVQKALCGMLKSALLFCHKLQKDLEDMGFEVNPSNPCVANETVNGSQMTVTWHVDDLKIYHVNGWEITQIIKKLAKK